MRDSLLEQGLKGCQDQIQEILQVTGDILDSQKKLESHYHSLNVKLDSINPTPAIIQHSQKDTTNIQ
jgi:hypothetical protein